ncbi:hypothetical protein L2E82_19412 [Cichorium intybus]|uniref:Uncharacterized protein n=1 Tax=Cichorium intybus TaxID=13427 RepID=A0ACB9FBC1_CICIN|nr:hypothetical protein L2E82_19412 [Cichorium intybus]
MTRSNAREKLLNFSYFAYWGKTKPGRKCFERQTAFIFKYSSINTVVLIEEAATCIISPKKGKPDQNGKSKESDNLIKGATQPKDVQRGSK